VLREAGHDAVVLEGAKSQFDVVADGSVVFSKQREGRFPEEGEVRELLAGPAG
jgi:predicted Rdx family selenoprotein